MKPSQESSKTARVWVQGWVLVLAFVASLDVLIGLWPAVEAATSSSGSSVTSTAATSVQVRLLFGLLPWKPSTSVALLGLVAVAGVLGSLVHTMDGFALHVADKDFDKAWNWWYLIRPLVGAGLAVLTYLLLRGQLLGINGSTTALNPYGIAGLAALTGLFSKQAAAKLKEVFDTLFAITNQSNPPTITSTNPATIPAAAEATVTVNGTRFGTALTATIDGTAAETHNVTTKSFELKVPQTAATVGAHTLIVTNPDGTSAKFTLTVTEH
jgi:hypothetical protein